MTRMILVLLTLWGACSGSAWAAFPEKALRLVVPFPAGSGLDRMARVTADRMAQQLGQSVVVENIGGASGTIAVDNVLAAPKDGHTVLFATMGTLVINPHIFKQLRHDPMRDLKAIGPVSMATNVLAVRPELKVKNLQDFIAYARANPGKLSYGSAGPGSSSHLAGVMLTSMAGLELNHVPYRGAAQAATDFLGGRIDVMMDAVTPYPALVRSDRAHVLALTSSRRFASLPPWPLMSEAGLPGFDMTVWTALMVPSGTPPDSLRVLRYALAAVQRSQQFRDVAAPDEPMMMEADEFEAFMKQENLKWARIVKASGVAASQ